MKAKAITRPADKDVPLRNDIHRLGDLLGERLRILGVHGHLGLEKSFGNRLQLECY